MSYQTDGDLYPDDPPELTLEELEERRIEDAERFLDENPGYVWN